MVTATLARLPSPSNYPTERTPVSAGVFSLVVIRFSLTEEDHV